MKRKLKCGLVMLIGAIVLFACGQKTDDSPELIISDNKSDEGLTVAVFLEDQDLNRLVSEFNRENADSHISVKVYDDYDINGGSKAFQTDVLSGNIPDIIDVTGVDFYEYTDKGMFYELNGFLNADADISEDDFLNNAVNAYRYKDKLYAIPKSVWVDSIVCKKDKLNGITVWDIFECRQWLERANGGKVTANISREEFFRQIMMRQSGAFVDRTGDKAHFNTEMYKELLEFVELFPKKSDMSSEAELLKDIRNDRIILYQTTLNSPLSFVLNQEIFAEEVTYVGYPSKDRCGTYLEVMAGAYAITQNCKEKETAWKFLKYVYANTDYKNAFPAYKPCLKKAFDAVQMRSDTAEASKQGETALTKVPVGRDYVEIFPASDDQIKELSALIESAQAPNALNTLIGQIIIEETEPYFRGQKGMDEVAEVIRSRVQMYLDE